MQEKELTEIITCLETPVFNDNVEYSYCKTTKYHWYLFLRLGSLPKSDRERVMTKMFGDLTDNPAISIDLKEIQGCTRAEVHIHRNKLRHLSKRYFLTTVVTTLINFNRGYVPWL